MFLRPLSYLALLSVLALIPACASAPAPKKSAEAYYQEGEAAYAKHNYEEAVSAWKKVRETYSSPELTTKAELNIADAHYDNKSYIEAAAAYEQFRKLHPSNEKSQYALYKLCLSHYNQITSIDTDQTPVKNAVLTMESFLKMYPASPFASEIREKLADCKLKQLEYENYVGSWYLRTGKYNSAIKRLSEALVRFPASPKLDETLFFLGKAYMKSGDTAKGKEMLNRLAKEYPQSPLNKDAAKLM